MHLDIITPEKTVFSEEIDEILVPTNKGQMGVLPHHINIVTQLTPGELIIKSKGKNRNLAVSGGFLEVNKGVLTLLADYAEHVNEIDIEKAKEAARKAQDLLSHKRKELSEEEIIRIEAELRLSLLQQHIGQRHRRNSS